MKWSAEMWSANNKCSVLILCRRERAWNMPTENTQIRSARFGQFTWNFSFKIRFWDVSKVLSAECFSRDSRQASVADRLGPSTNRSIYGFWYFEAMRLSERIFVLSSFLLWCSMAIASGVSFCVASSCSVLFSSLLWHTLSGLETSQTSIQRVVLSSKVEVGGGESGTWRMMMFACLESSSCRW